MDCTYNNEKLLMRRELGVILRRNRNETLPVTDSEHLFARSDREQRFFFRYRVYSRWMMSIILAIRSNILRIVLELD